MRQLVGGLIVMTVIALIAFPLGWATEDGWRLSEPSPSSGAIRCPASLEWMGLGGDVEAARTMAPACRGPLRLAAVAGGIGVVLAILAMGMDRFFSHDPTN